MKNWRPLLLSFLSLPSLWFTHPSHAEPLIWKATKGHQQLMLIGTIHLGNDTMYPLPKVLAQFLKNSDGLVLEADITQPTPSMDFSQQVKTKDILNTEQRQALIELASQLKLSADTLLNLPPWVVAISIENQTMQQIGYDSENGVDTVLLKQAKESNIPLMTFETLEQQLNMLQTLPDNGKDLLLSTMDEGDSRKNHYSCLIKSWKAGKQDTLLTMLDDSDWDENTRQSLLYQRNNQWVKKIINPQFLTPTGHYLIAVGTLHLIGKHSVIQSLAESGYSIEQVSHSEEYQCKTNKESSSL